MKLTIKQIAAREGVTTQAVRYWIAQGLPVHHEPRKGVVGPATLIMIDTAELKQWRAGR
jgi:hypothetical protein